jgi:hypothetical protein
MSNPHHPITADELGILQPALIRYHSLPPYSTERHDFLNSIVALLAPFNEWDSQQVRHWFTNNRSAYLHAATTQNLVSPDRVMQEVQKLRDLVTQGFTKLHSLLSLRDPQIPITVPFPPANRPHVPGMPLPLPTGVTIPTPGSYIPPSPPSTRPTYLPDLDGDGPSSNPAFEGALTDPTLACNPRADGFLPSDYWLETQYTFGEVVQSFFQRKHSTNCRFIHKLFNGLTLVDKDARFYDLVGVKWVTDRVFKVDKLLFGRLLGIGNVDDGLFHHQGMLRESGFSELSQNDANALKQEGCDIGDVDQERVRLWFHATNSFYRNCDEATVNSGGWAGEAGSQ